MLPDLRKKGYVLCCLLALLALVACARATPPTTPRPADTPAATVTAVSTPTPTRAAAGSFLPIVQNPAAATAVPALTAPAPTPTVKPTPPFPRYSGPPLQRAQMGIQIHIHREDQRALLRHLHALDLGWVKVQVSWKLYQPQPDAYANDRLAELDALVEAATNNGMRVLLSVSKAPEWSRPTTELDGPPDDFALFEAFMAFLAARYNGRVAAYELWNEPNLQREWNGAPLDPAALTRLVAAGAAGARRGDPEALLISAPPATTGINDGVTAIDDRVYLRGMLAAGVGQYVDGIGVHPYGWANPPDSSAAAPDTAVPSHNNHPSFFFGDTLADYQALLDEFGLSQPLWATEFGWGSFDGLVDDDGEPALPPPGAEFMAYVDEQQQAAYILRAFELAQAEPGFGPLILWNLNFGPLLGSDFSESGYSILRPDDSLRPAYRSLQAATKE